MIRSREAAVLTQHCPSVQIAYAHTLFVYVDYLCVNDCRFYEIIPMLHSMKFGEAQVFMLVELAFGRIAAYRSVCGKNSVLLPLVIGVSSSLLAWQNL